MATTNENITLSDSTTQNILLGSSTSFIVQNLSDKRIHYKIKDSIVTGGIMMPYESYSFNYDITVWQDSSVPTTTSTLFILRG